MRDGVTAFSGKYHLKPETNGPEIFVIKSVDFSVFS